MSKRTEFIIDTILMGSMGGLMVIAILLLTIDFITR